MRSGFLRINEIIFKKKWNLEKNDPFESQWKTSTHAKFCFIKRNH